MIRRSIVVALLFISSLAVDLDTAHARRGGFFRRARSTRATNYRASNHRARYYRRRSVSKSSTRPTKLHETHSRSAVLDGFFGSGGQGHDRSWYVGR